MKMKNVGGKCCQKMELEKKGIMLEVENGIRNIGKWNYLKMVLKFFENIIIWKWNHWKMELESLENGVGNIKKKLETFETGISNIEN